MTDRDPTPLNATWRGAPLYRCRLCSFDTMEEQKFIDHFASMHPPLEIIDGGLSDAPAEAPQPVTEAELNKMSRAELNANAGWFGLTTDAEDYGNKDELIAAILAANAPEGGE